MRLIRLDKPLFHGPVTISGHLRGHTGSREEMLTSLAGALEGEAGPGRIKSNTSVGDALFNVFSLIHIEGILPGKKRDSFAEGGIPYSTLKTKAELQGGVMNTNHTRLLTPAVNIVSTGTVDFVSERLKVEMAMEILKNADKVLGYVPLIGKIAREVTEVHLEMTGSFEKPEMHLLPATGITEGIKDELKSIRKRFRHL